MAHDRRRAAEISRLDPSPRPGWASGSALQAGAETAPGG